MSTTNSSDVNDQIETGNESDNPKLSPIARLFSDDTSSSSEEPRAYVQGYDLSPDEESVDHVPESPAAIPGSEEDLFEEGVHTVRPRVPRERDKTRRRPPNPAPKPAVRAAVPPAQRRVPPPQNRDDGPEDEQDYDNFRQRYSQEGELISAGRGGRPVRKTRDSRPSYVRAEERDADGTNPLRLMVAVIALCFLILMVILIVQNRSLRSQRNDLQDRVGYMQVDHDRYVAAREEIELQNDEIAELEEQIAYYRAQLQANDGGQAPGGTPGDTPGGETEQQPGQTQTPPAITFPAQHTVTSGQTLSAIAVQFYGSGTPAEIYLWAVHIRQYNNLPNDNIYIGQRLTIPERP